MKLIVAGVRIITDEKLVHEWLDVVASGHNIEVVYTGGSKGIERAAETWAKLNEIPVKIYRARWKVNGIAAAPIRNREMVEKADGLVLIWDGTRKDSLNLLFEAKRKNIKIFEKKLLPHEMLGTVEYPFWAKKNKK